MVTPALYRCVITHVRSTPLRNAFTYDGYLWLVDLDDLPKEFDPGARASLDAFLADHGERAGRVTMLAGRRTLGYVFNPLTVYWCDTGVVVAEVRNTYGGSTATCSIPTRTAAPGRARSSTCRPSTPSTATTRSGCRRRPTGSTSR